MMHWLRHPDGKLTTEGEELTTKWGLLREGLEAVKDVITALADKDDDLAGLSTAIIEAHRHQLTVPRELADVVLLRLCKSLTPTAGDLEKAVLPFHMLAAAQAAHQEATAAAAEAWEQSRRSSAAAAAAEDEQEPPAGQSTAGDDEPLGTLPPCKLPEEMRRQLIRALGQDLVAAIDFDSYCLLSAEQFGKLQYDWVSVVVGIACSTSSAFGLQAFTQNLML